MTETKIPQPGEYWVSDDGSIIRIVGVKLNGGVIYENQAGFSFQFNSMTNWRHEPRCTGFDWVEPPAIDPGEGYELLPDGEVLQEGDQFEAIGKWRNTNNAGRKKLPGWTYRRKIKPVETWPKYYICDTWVLAAYILRKSSGPLVIVNMDGSVEKPGRPWQEHDEYQYKHGFYREVTEAEALARVKPVEVWPKWYVRTNPNECYRNHIAYSKMTSADSGETFRKDGSSFKWSENNPNGWIEVTESEALARVTPDTSRRTNDSNNRVAGERFDHGKRIVGNSG